MDSHCVESEESELGGFCAALKQAPSINRALQQNVTCVEMISEDDAAACNCTYACDCSQFNNTSGFGTFACTGTGEYCLGESMDKCGAVENRVNATFNADGSYNVVDCLYDVGGVFDAALGLESYCYSFSSDLTSVECEITVNGVACKICEYDQVTCPANSSDHLRTVFDCTNTVMNMKGNMCDTDPINSFVDAGMPRTDPLETDPPSASPTPPATSSGSSLTAKVTIVVSAAAGAWMASFGI
jgi:hypothetical protein